MKYRDEIHIAMMALVFSCAMFAIYAVVPKDAVVAAKARATVTEAPDSNYDYDDSSDNSDSYDPSYDNSSDTGTDNSDTDNSYVNSSTDNNSNDGSSDNVVDEGVSQPGDYDYPDSTDDGGDGFTYYEPDNTGTDDTTSSDNGDYVEE